MDTQDRPDPVATARELGPAIAAASDAIEKTRRIPAPLLARLHGGCLAPIGALGVVEGGRLELSAVVLSPDGAERLHERGSALPDQAETLGRKVADTLLSRGAGELIAAGRTM